MDPFPLEQRLNDSVRLAKHSQTMKDTMKEASFCECVNTGSFAPEEI